VGSIVTLSDRIKLLGVTLDTDLTFDDHVNTLTKSAYFHIRALRHFRSCLTEEAAKLVACSIVSSRLDYSNSLLFGMSQKNINKLQVVQNALAKVVLRAPWRSHSSDNLRSLHWLPIRERIQFKIATLVYKCRSNAAPSYLSSCLADHKPARLLRSSSDFALLKVPTVCTKFSSRGFSSAAPEIWNPLPFSVRTSASLPCFKNNLKTFLFQQTYGN